MLRILGSAKRLCDGLTRRETLRAGGVVQTEDGAVSGLPGINPAVMVFKGIPFAAPPVGDLRWKPPMPPAKWSGVLEADHLSPSCTHVTTTRFTTS